MNKETRIFILGIIISALSVFSLSIQINEMRSGIWDVNVFNVVVFICTILGLIIGAKKIAKTL